MIFVALKVPFLIASFMVWRNTSNEAFAAAVWGLASFLATFFIIGVTSSIATYGVIAFAAAWVVFLLLRYVDGSMWYLPSAGIAGIALLLFT